ncbi:hypothetical protein EVAR_79282_1 [Eumeta japonica]|uniref:Uncharacterized protein n=1 Tax=Eumeta variegata TaxID=151549 RepID=A0A4C1TFQ7_EUMVA|nr:hypothetical protein EVAR_79282_1 [Eumeta japonica]
MAQVRGRICSVRLWNFVKKLSVDSRRGQGVTCRIKTNVDIVERMNVDDVIVTNEVLKRTHSRGVPVTDPLAECSYSQLGDLDLASGLDVPLRRLTETGGLAHFYLPMLEPARNMHQGYRWKQGVGYLWAMHGYTDVRCRVGRFQERHKVVTECPVDGADFASNLPIAI